MGTDYSSDFEKRDTDEGIYRFGTDKACGKATCRVVNVTPEKGLLNNEFGRIEMQVHPKAQVPLRTLFFAKDGKTLVKSMTINRLRKHQGRYVVFAATMKDLNAPRRRAWTCSPSTSMRSSAKDFSEAAAARPADGPKTTTGALRGRLLHGVVTREVRRLEAAHATHAAHTAHVGAGCGLFTLGLLSDHRFGGQQEGPETEAANCSAQRQTLVGSTTPAPSRSVYSSAAAL